MLDEICRELNNWFDRRSDGSDDRYFGTFTIDNGEIDLSETNIQTGQFFRIVGSVFNDGIHQYPTIDLTDEIFDGAVWLMAVPSEIISLAEEIREWKDKYSSADSPAMSPYQSESFGGYSYTKASNSTENGSSAITWQSQFANRLNKWRKIR